MSLSVVIAFVIGGLVLVAGHFIKTARIRRHRARKVANESIRGCFEGDHEYETFLRSATVKEQGRGERP